MRQPGVLHKLQKYNENILNVEVNLVTRKNVNANIPDLFKNGMNNITGNSYRSENDLYLICE